MKVGDLVRVKNSVTGDIPEMVKLWRDRTPCLLLHSISHHWTCVLDKDVYRKIPTHRLEVVSESR